MTPSARHDLLIRLAADDDEAALAAFTCSTGPWYEREVEDYVRGHAHRRAMATPDTYRLLLALMDGRLVGCAAHHPEALQREESTPTYLLATRLQLLAIRTPDQGRRLSDGRGLADTIMHTLIHDALHTRPHSPVLTAVVAQDNLRSIAMCERNGLRSQTRYDMQHVRLTALFAKR